MAPHTTSHIPTDAQDYITRGLAALNPKISPVAAELYMLGIDQGRLVELKETAAEFHAKHQALIFKLQSTLSPAICNKYSGCPKNFRQNLLVKLDIGKKEIFDAFQSPNVNALADLVKKIGPLPTGPLSPTTIPSVAKADLSSLTLPPAPAPSAATTLSAKRAEEPPRKTDATHAPVQAPLGTFSSRLATAVKIGAAGLISIFAGMHQYGKHRDAIRSKVAPDLLPVYDATETALYGTYRAEKSALQAMAQAFNHAINGTKN
jgi:hypothetical protein